MLGRRAVVGGQADEAIKVSSDEQLSGSGEGEASLALRASAVQRATCACCRLDWPGRGVCYSLSLTNAMDKEENVACPRLGCSLQIIYTPCADPLVNAHIAHSRIPTTPTPTPLSRLYCAISPGVLAIPSRPERSAAR